MSPQSQHIFINDIVIIESHIFITIIMAIESHIFVNDIIANESVYNMQKATNLRL